MPKFLVRQRRPMWVCFVQEIEADDEDAAEEAFHDAFDPQHSVVEGYVQRVDPGPVTVFIASGFAAPLDVADAD